MADTPTTQSEEQKAFVKVLRHGATEPELASKLVWWLASLAAYRYGAGDPQIGDIVIETTHRLGLAKQRVGLLSAVGELIKIEEDPDFKGSNLYTIRTLTGKEQRWSNASFAVVEKKR